MRWQGPTDGTFCTFLQVDWSEHSEVVETHKPYLLQSNSFELFVLTGGMNANLLSHPFQEPLCELSRHLISCKNKKAFQ